MRRVFRSLALRLLVPLLATLFVGFSGYAFLQARSWSTHFSQMMEEHAQQAATLIKDATHHSMLLNQRGEIQEALEKIAAGPGVARLRVYDKKGRIAFSSLQEEIGIEVDMRADACNQCHSGPRPSRKVTTKQRTRLYRNDRGEGIMGFIEPIANAPECRNAACHAHSPGDTILGVLDVQLSTARLDDAHAVAIRQLILTTIAGFLIVGIGTVLFVQRMVRRPVRHLREGTERVAQGDLAFRLEVESNDELSALARAFNKMTADLERTDRELKAWSQELETKVAKKTEEIALMQRHQVQVDKMASLGKLSAVVAHELNNPLGGILTYAKLIEKKLRKQSVEPKVSDEMIRWLSLIQSESMRCGDIVRNLLLFARRGGGKREPVSANELIERVAMLVRHQVELNQIELKIEKTSGDDTLVGDVSELQQALLALMINAIEASSSGHGRVGMAVVGAEDTITFLVKDNGTGIQADVLPHIFEPFFSTKERGGVGIGLAVAYGIAGRHGGTIEVSSEVGVGSVFSMCLKRRSEEGEGSSISVTEVSSSASRERVGS